MGRTATMAFKLAGGRPLHCSSCENTLQLALSMLPGVRRVRADRRSQRVELVCDPDEADLDQVTARLELLGYEAVRA